MALESGNGFGNAEGLLGWRDVSQKNKQDLATNRVYVNESRERVTGGDYGE